MDQLVNLSSRAPAAPVILIAGVMSAGWLAELVGREAEGAGLRASNVFRRAVFTTIFAAAALLDASQLGLEIFNLVLLAAVVLVTGKGSPFSPATSPPAATSRATPRWEM